MGEEFIARYLVRDSDFLGPLGYKPDLPVIEREEYLSIKSKLEEKGVPSSRRGIGCELSVDYGQVHVEATSPCLFFKYSGKNVLEFMSENKRELVSLLKKHGLTVSEFLKE